MMKKESGHRSPLFVFGIVYGRFSESESHLEISCATTIKLLIFDFKKSRNIPSPCTARQSVFESAFSK